MARLPLLAVFTFAAAVEAQTCPGGCGDDEFCRTAVAASGVACDATAQTCAKLSVRGETCGGGGGEAQDCFRNRCKSPLACRESKAGAEFPGTCVKQCDIGEGVMVNEGWRGPGAGEGKWCHTRFCDGSDDTKAAGVLQSGDETAACPTGLADGLRCCVGAGESGQVCCGVSGGWVTPDGKVTCGHVLAKADSTGAPFSVTCTGVCDRPGATDAVDDRWKGPSAEDGEWCNTCLCARGKLTCTDRVCPALRCCSPGDKKENQVCCGLTGEWVTKDAGDGTVTCAGATLPYADDLETQPFVAACAGKRSCTLVSNVEVTFLHGEKRRDPRAGRGCLECECADGKLVCEGGVCPAPQCCAEAKPTDGAVYVCCGLDGAWKKVDGAGTCGSHATQVAAQPAAGYPFFEECAARCAVNTGVGGPDEEVSLGWAGQKGGFMKGGVPTAAAWCDTCVCAVAAGEPAGTAPVVTCTTHEACPEMGCCRAPAPTPVEDYACCGVSRRWVRVAEGKVLCGGVTVAKAPATDPPTAPTAPLGGVCTKQCTLTGGVVLDDGRSGRAAGADWCNLCRCEGGTPQCTMHTCTRRCCAVDKATLPADAVWRCCGATGEWVRRDAADTYNCGGAQVADGAEQLYAGEGTAEETGVCAPVADTKCKLYNAAETQVGQGWAGPGLGDRWCHRCRCRAEDLGAKVSCATEACPAAEELRCCAKTQGTDEVCCGLTGEWVARDAMCGAVDLRLAGIGGAPVTAACEKCTLEGGVKVAAGWFDFAPGANWCNKCYCGADGKLRCTQRECRAPTCCARPKGADTDVCCGATGEWVSAEGEKYACGMFTVDKTDTDKLPFFEACAETCVLPDTTPVAVGWWGKRGDGCNYCYCAGHGDLKCSERVCPNPLCSTYVCSDVFTSLEGKPDKDNIRCSGTSCTAHECCGVPPALLVSPAGGTLSYPAPGSPDPVVGDVFLWVIFCEGRLPQVNVDSFDAVGDSATFGVVELEIDGLGNEVIVTTDPLADFEHVGKRALVVFFGGPSATFSLRYKCIDP